MAETPVEITAEQVVRWLLAEKRAGRLGLDVRAIRSYVSEPVADFGEDERSDLGEVVAVGMLEVSPLSAADGWIFCVSAWRTLWDRACQATNRPRRVRRTSILRPSKLSSSPQVGPPRK